MCCGSARGGEGARGSVMSKGHMKPAAVRDMRWAIMRLKQMRCGVTNDQ